MGRCIKILLLIALCLSPDLLLARYKPYAKTNADQLSYGLGYGLDYGGVGINILYYLNPNVGMFAGVGYPFAGIGFNAGTKFRFDFNQPTRVHPYLIGMYGYNTAISSLSKAMYDKLFYGPSAGLGVDFMPKRGSNNYFSFGILFPFRGSEVSDYVTQLKAQGVSVNNPLPISITVGYRFVID